MAVWGEDVKLGRVGQGLSVTREGVVTVREEEGSSVEREGVRGAEEMGECLAVMRSEGDGVLSGECRGCDICRR